MSRKKLIIKKGQRFNKFVIVREVERVSKHKRRFLCKCDCGNTKEVNLIHLTANKIKSCGCATREWHKKHKRNLNPNWKGGKREVGGYIEVYKPEHPFARGNGYIKEHRLVMEKSLGRYLYEKENVHHINGNKKDNKIENLELWNTSQPAGQRVKDKLKWARKIIKLYG